MRYETQKTRRPGHADTATDTLARGLGWFSIALGIAEVAAPRAISRFLGIRRHESLIRAYGFREIATGVGILASRDPTPWIWGRIGGDALDLATLATGLERVNRNRDNAALAMAAVAGVTAIDVYCATVLSGETTEPMAPAADYTRRSGPPKGVEQTRGLARRTGFEQPRDMRAPEAMRPYTVQ
jgi:hypothetical protein